MSNSSSLFFVQLFNNFFYSSILDYLFALISNELSQRFKIDLSKCIILWRWQILLLILGHPIPFCHERDNRQKVQYRKWSHTYVGIPNQVHICLVSSIYFCMIHFIKANGHVFASLYDFSIGFLNCSEMLFFILNWCSCLGTTCITIIQYYDVLQARSRHFTLGFWEQAIQVV
jgi:hypothetical protein